MSPANTQGIEDFDFEARLPNTFVTLSDDAVGQGIIDIATVFVEWPSGNFAIVASELDCTVGTER